MADSSVDVAAGIVLCAGEGATAVFDARNDAIDVREVLPEEASNIRVLWDAFGLAVRKEILGQGALDWHIVDVGDSNVRNFRLEDVGDVVMEDRHRVGPPHGQGDEPKGAEWGLESGEIARSFGDEAFVVANVEVESGSASATGELFGDVFGNRGNAGMLDGDCVQRFEAMDEAKRFAVLLDDAEPTRTIGRIRRLVDPGVDFASNDLADFVVDARRDGNVALHPRSVGNNGDLDGWEEVCSKRTALRIVPSERSIVEAHEVVDEIPFGRA